MVTKYWVEIACSVVVYERKISDLKVWIDLDKTTYRSGEIGRLEIKANKDCYITVFSIWANEAIGVFLPNELIPVVQLKASEIFRIPDPEDPVLQYLKPAFYTLPGARENTEYFKVVATETLQPFLGGLGPGALKPVELAPGVEVDVIEDPQEALKEVYSWFLSIPPDEVAVEQVGYVVVKE